VVLVDDYSASASEILAGAVQDWDRGVIVGRRTFGKGLVQRPIELPDGSLIRLTTARYYTPAGRCIQKPYEGGDRTDYDKELAERLEHGEMSHPDSIHFSDSLRYATRVLHRTVYGGGGIMPDIFVPIDTAWATPLYRRLSARGILIKWAMQYTEQNREQLKADYPAFDRFDKTYRIPADALVHLRRLAEEANIDWNEEQLEASSETLHTQFKALLARNLWGMTEYFQIVNRLSNPYLEGVAILKDGRYEESLRSPK
jgi:carboxyl-terminal processing protease